MWRRILAYLLFGLGFLTITFFKNYTGSVIPNPTLFWVLGIAMFWGGYLILRYSPTSKEWHHSKEMAAIIRELKEYGERIKVDLLQCELKENHFVEEKERYGHNNELLTLDLEREIQIMNAFEGDSLRNIKQVQVNQTIIIFYHPNQRTGKTERFISRIIPKDKVTLSFFLDKQKQTTLYVDKVNRERYWFDLDFLADK